MKLTDEQIEAYVNAFGMNETTMDRLILLAQDKQVCTKCKQVKYISKFSKDKEKIIGYRSTCNECRNSNGKEKRRNKKLQFIKLFREKEKLIKNNIEHCTRCKRTLPITKEYWPSKADGSIISDATGFPVCLPCVGASKTQVKKNAETPVRND